MILVLNSIALIILLVYYIYPAKILPFSTKTKPPPNVSCLAGILVLPAG
jgi:hypothetical protein